MKRVTTLGLVLLVLGVAAFLVPRFTYTDREQVIEIGPIEATARIEETVAVPQWLAGLLLGMGVALVAVGATKRA